MKKTIYFLLIFLLGISSCSRDNYSSIDNSPAKYEKKQITFKEFLRTEGNKSEVKKIQKYFQGDSENKNGENINWKIDTTKVTKIIKPDITTYTFAVIENENIQGFRNVVIKTNGDETVAYLVHYPDGVDFENGTPRKAYMDEIEPEIISNGIGISVTCYQLQMVYVECSDGTCEWGWDLVEVPCEGGGTSGNDSGSNGDNSGNGGNNENGGDPGSGSNGHTPSGGTDVPTDPNPGNGSSSEFDTFFMGLFPYQKEWITNPENGEFAGIIYTYLDNNNYSSDAYEFVYWAIDFLIENPNVTPTLFKREFITFPPPNIPIANIQDFLSVFNINQPANLTVYAQKMFGDNGVGHAFISITQGNNTRTFGFYPKQQFPRTIDGPSIYGNDSGHPYTYGWNTGTISSTQLQQIIGVAIAFSHSNYNVLNNNCSDFANYALQVVGMNINTTGVDTPDTIIKLISSYAQYTNGNAP